MTLPDTASPVRRTTPVWVKASIKEGFRLLGSATSSQRPLPEFLVIGTKRGGTTTMLRALQDHPLVLPMVPAAANIKSPHYFDLDYGRGEEWYRSHFATVRDRVKAGVEPLGLREALEAEARRLAGERERLVAEPLAHSERFEHFSYLARGRYAEQLRDWFEVIPRERFLIMRSEDLYRDPQATYERALDFLGLPPHRRSGPFGRHHGHADRPKVPPATAEHLRDHFAPHNHDLADLLGEDEVWW